jgi:hypothetical protein
MHGLRRSLHRPRMVALLPISPLGQHLELGAFWCRRPHGVQRDVPCRSHRNRRAFLLVPGTGQTILP